MARSPHERGAQCPFHYVICCHGQAPPKPLACSPCNVIWGSPQRKPHRIITCNIMAIHTNLKKWHSRDVTGYYYLDYKMSSGQLKPARGGRIKIHAGRNEIQPERTNKLPKSDDIPPSTYLFPVIRCRDTNTTSRRTEWTSRVHDCASRPSSFVTDLRCGDRGLEDVKSGYVVDRYLVFNLRPVSLILVHRCPL